MSDQSKPLTADATLDARMAMLSPDKQALLRERLARDANPDEGPSTRSRSDESFPPSAAQQRVWFLEQYEQDTPIYNIARGWWLEGHVEVVRLRGALAQMIERHESLRTVFRTEEAQLRQRVLAAIEVELPLIDLTALPTEEARRAAAKVQAESLACQRFNLEHGPLLRLSLVRVAESSHLLVLVIHHLISDGWSLSVFYRDLSALYADRADTLPTVAVRYVDYARWQREALESGKLAADFAYWRTALSDVSTLDLPTDRPRPSIQSHRGATCEGIIPKELTERLRTLGRREKGTLFMVLLAAFQVLLSRYSGQEDIAVGCPIAGRARDDFENLIGFFVNTLVLRTDLSGNPRFSDLLRRVRETAFDAYHHQYLPFDALVEDLNPKRDTSRSPLIQTMLNLQNIAGVEPTLPSVTATPQALHTATAKFDLTVIVEEAPVGLRVIWEYATDLFDASTIARMARHFEHLLEGVAADPDQRLGDLPLLSKAERRELIGPEQAPVEQTSIRCIHHLVEAQAARSPSRVARPTAPAAPRRPNFRRR